MAKKKITISDMIDRFGRERIVKALTKRRFTNKKRSEMRKTGQKHMGFMSGGFGIFSKSKNVEAGEPDKKKKKNVIKENVTKKQKRLEELKKELGMKKGGMKKADGIMIIMEKKKKGGEAKIKKVIGGLKKASKLHAGQAKMLSTIVKKAAGGITGKETVGELRKRFGTLKKGIRLKGKGSSFMKEYKKRVYNRAGGGSVNGGARGTGIAVKGHNFKGVF